MQRIAFIITDRASVQVSIASVLAPAVAPAVIPSAPVTVYVPLPPAQVTLEFPVFVPAFITWEPAFKFAVPFIVITSFNPTPAFAVKVSAPVTVVVEAVVRDIPVVPEAALAKVSAPKVTVFVLLFVIVTPEFIVAVPPKVIATDPPKAAEAVKVTAPVLVVNIVAPVEAVILFPKLKVGTTDGAPVTKSKLPPEFTVTVFVKVFNPVHDAAAVHWIVPETLVVELAVKAKAPNCKIVLAATDTAPELTTAAPSVVVPLVMTFKFGKVYAALIAAVPVVLKVAVAIDKVPRPVIVPVSWIVDAPVLS